MVNKVFLITGNKITAFITDEISLKFSSAASDTVDDFKEAFANDSNLHLQDLIHF